MWVQCRQRLLAWRLLLLWVGLVGVLPLLNSFEDARSMELGIEDLLVCFGVGRTPYLNKLKECRGCQKRVGGLPGDGVSSRHVCKKTPRAALPGHLVRFYGALSSIKRFLRELLDVGLARDIVYDGVVCSILCLGLQARSESALVARAHVCQNQPSLTCPSTRSCISDILRPQYEALWRGFG